VLYAKYYLLVRQLPCELGLPAAAPTGIRRLGVPSRFAAHAHRTLRLAQHIGAASVLEGYYPRLQAGSDSGESAAQAALANAARLPVGWLKLQ
jgi:hypothetical protein